MSNCKVIALTNQKGGVGKTTTAVNLGVGLAKQGKKVLLIDADAQANLTMALGYNRPDDIPITLSTVMQSIIDDKSFDASGGILHHGEGVDLLPSNIELSGFEVRLINAMSRERVLKTYVNEVMKNYDYVLIDCMPSLGMITINALAAADRYLINNANFESYIKIVKKDAETGKTIPYAGAGFQIYDPSGSLVSMTFTYPEVTTIDTFYTTADGDLITPQTLEYGKGYSLVEVQAPYGYVLNSEPVYFDVVQENSEEESGIIVIEVVRSNMAQKGTVTVTKSGEVFSTVAGDKGLYQPIFSVGNLEGAVYEITATEDIYTLDGTLRASKGEVVDTVTTGKDGTAKSKELYLGKYEVKEVNAPFGFVLNEEIHAVELVYAGQEIAVTETATGFVNERQRVEIDLVKALEIDKDYGVGENGEFADVTFVVFIGGAALWLNIRHRKNK